MSIMIKGAGITAKMTPAMFAGAAASKLRGLASPTTSGQSPLVDALAQSRAALSLNNGTNLGGTVNNPLADLLTATSGSLNIGTPQTPGAGITAETLSEPIGGSIKGSVLGTTSRGALGQFSSSLSAGNIGAKSSAVQKTSLAALGEKGNNPWYDMRGRRTSALDCATMYNLKQVRPGNVDLRKNQKNPDENAIDFDDAGTIKKLNHRDGAGAHEIGAMNLIAGLATIPYTDGRGNYDPRAVTATNNSVKDAHKWHAPLGRRISWALSRGKVPRYVQNLENDRLEREKLKARITGAAAYVKGESGNAYTRFLQWKFGGELDDTTRSLVAYTADHTDTTLGGFNLNWEHGIMKLDRMGQDINPATMGITSHEGFIGMKPSEQPQAVPAVLQLMNGYLAEMGITPANKKVWNNSGLHWAAADGVLRVMTPQHFRAARAIGDIEGISAVTPQRVNEVLHRHRQAGLSEQAHSYEKVVLGQDLLEAAKSRSRSRTEIPGMDRNYDGKLSR